MINYPYQVQPLLRAILGTQVELLNYQTVKSQIDYCVILASLHRPSIQIVIKLAGPAAHMASQFDRTVAIQGLVANSTTIPMPEVIAMDVSGRQWPWRYLIYKALPGEEWAILRDRMSGDDLASAYRQFGDAVAQLHHIGFPAFGEIDAQGEVLQPNFSCPAALREHARKIISNPRLLDAFLAALEKHSSCFEAVQDIGLCHEDLHGYNILFTRQAGEWRLSTILDLDKAWAGHPETDLARLELWRGMTTPDFWSAYRALRPLDEGYLQRRPIYQLLWCLEYARSTQEHLWDTRKVCEELGIPIITSFD